MRAGLPARINRIKEREQLKREEPMSYTLRFSTRKFDGLFGTAYPRLKKIPNHKRESIISLYLSHISNNSKVTVDYNEITPFTSAYSIIIDTGGRQGYNAALEIEQICRGFKRLNFLSPPRWWNRFAPFRHPSDTFMINDLEMGPVIEWLLENCKTSDYQIFTKFEKDISIGFCDGENAAMFKLTFGEEDI